MKIAVRFVLVCAFFMGVSSKMNAQKSKADLKCALYQAYINDEMLEWQTIIEEMVNLQDSSEQWQQEIVLAHYSLAGYFLGNHRKAEAKLEIDQATARLEELLENDDKSAWLYSLKASFLSLQMGISRIQAPVLYPRHQVAIARAEELDPHEPLVIFEQANMLYHLPGLFGGDKKAAIQKYELSLTKLMGKEVANCDWFQLMVRLFLLKAYRETGEQEAYETLLNQIEQQHGKLSWLPRFLDSKMVD